MKLIRIFFILVNKRLLATHMTKKNILCPYIEKVEEVIYLLKLWLITLLITENLCKYYGIQHVYF
jgi:hypothetical protein